MKIREMMSMMNEKHPDDEFGVFVMSKKTMKEFRQERGNWFPTFLGHKLKTVKGCPDDKIYLMSKDEFTEFETKLSELIIEKKKQSAKHINSNLRKL